MVEGKRAVVHDIRERPALLEVVVGGQAAAGRL